MCTVNVRRFTSCLYTVGRALKYAAANHVSAGRFLPITPVGLLPVSTAAFWRNLRSEPEDMQLPANTLPVSPARKPGVNRLSGITFKGYGQLFYRSVQHT